jgi:predicted TPR repeat methyltransferase
LRYAVQVAEVTIDQALSYAILLHQSAFSAGSREDLERARAVYERIIEAMPEHADALHYLGVLLHQTGSGEQALELIGRAIAARPDDAMIYNNLGNVLAEQQRHGEAADAYRTAIALGQAGADAESNLGVALKAAGKTEQAMAAFERALGLQPDHAPSHGNLGGMLYRARRYQEAIVHLEQAVASDPQLASVRQNLALALHRSGRKTQAIATLRGWLEVEPESPAAAHFLAAFSQQDVPERASDGFVRSAFDAMANSFEHHLKDLRYRAPELIAAALTPVLGAPEGRLDVLDAGCGTGLCGASLRPYAKRLIGVDLSPGMLKKAEPRQVYDELVEAELTAFVAARSADLDLVVSADTLCYFGDLTAILRATRRALRLDGVLSFTVERSATNAQSFLLQAHGRYSHSEDYVRDTLRAEGFELHSLEVVELRMEGGEPVLGLLVVAFARLAPSETPASK